MDIGLVTWLLNCDSTTEIWPRHLNLSLINHMEDNLQEKSYERIPYVIHKSKKYQKETNTPVFPLKLFLSVWLSYPSTIKYIEIL